MKPVGWLTPQERDITGFTPGEWTAHHGERDSRIAATTLLAIVYSTAFKDTANQEANSDLMALAPKLLAHSAAADKLLSECAELIQKQYESTGGCKCETCDKAYAMLSRLREAGIIQ